LTISIASAPQFYCKNAKTKLSAMRLFE